MTPDLTKRSQTMPEIFAVETVLGCDLKCPECAAGGDFIRRKKGAMALDQFKVVADKIRPFCKFLYLHIWGEPMLNKDIFKMIEYAAAFTATNISTNGQSLTPEKALKLIRSGVTDIIVSIDGVSQKVYEQYRAGGHVDKAMDALGSLQRYNIEYGRKVRIIPQFIVMQHNQHEMEAFNELCKSLELQPTFKSPYIRDPHSRFSPSNLERFRRPTYPDLPALKSAMRHCESVHNTFNILLDGSVVACCHDYGGFTSFGNLLTQNVRDIWNSANYRIFRSSVASGNTPDFCIQKCMSYFLAKPTAPFQNKTIPLRPAADGLKPLKINLCSGAIKLDGYVNVDIVPGSDIILDLEHDLLPFPDNSADIVVCISAINYFSRQRAQEILRDVYRVLKPGGVCRFATQDLRLLTERYLKNNLAFYFQKLPNGKDRFPGKTFGEKLNEFFYGFYSGTKHCKFVYDYETLKLSFEEAGFDWVENKAFQESHIPDISKIDNRPDQMFFLEAGKGNSGLFTVSSTQKRLGSEDCLSGAPMHLHNDIETLKDRALCLWAKGENEKAWQLFLKVLTHRPDDHAIAFKCFEVLFKSGRYEDILELVKNFQKAAPGDLFVRDMVAKVIGKLKTDGVGRN